jgi:gamma-glutamyltranspeptidase/glutathione hydrolase
MDELLSTTYADRRRELIGAAASQELRPGAVAGRSPVIPEPAPIASDSAPPAAGEPVEALRRHRGDTSHIDAVDRDGNLVSATPSGGWLHGSPVIRGLGFCLGTRAQMFWLDDGHPNSLEPGKRPRTTLSPTLVLEGDQPRLALGTPGGDSQDQWSLIALLRHLHHGLDLQTAIDEPMFRTGHLVHSFYPRTRELGLIEVEDRVGGAVVRDLRRLGHDVSVVGPWTLGRVCAVGRDDSGVVKAAASNRGQTCYAVGR